MDKSKIISGHNRIEKSLLDSIFVKYIYKLKYHVPLSIKSNHLTILTLVYSILIVFFSFLAQNNKNWLWLTSLLVIFQYITDTLDGELGRFRKEGLIKWGFYVDHFLDYIFASSVFISYFFVFPENKLMSLFILIIIAGFFIHEAFKSLALFSKYHVSGYYGFGGTELKALVVLINTLVILLPKNITQWIPIIILIISLLSLIMVVYSTQKKLWHLDMEIKNQKNIK